MKKMMRSHQELNGQAQVDGEKSMSEMQGRDEEKGESQPEDEEKEQGVEQLPSYQAAVGRV